MVMIIDRNCSWLNSVDRCYERLLFIHETCLTSNISWSLDKDDYDDNLDYDDDDDGNYDDDDNVNIQPSGFTALASLKPSLSSKPLLTGQQVLFDIIMRMMMLMIMLMMIMMTVMVTMMMFVKIKMKIIVLQKSQFIRLFFFPSNFRRTSDDSDALATPRFT